jgi:DNA-binding response OmpR family regulator/DNA-binding CsgD family transcriptional regulator
MTTAPTDLIMVVDDDLQTRQMLTAALEQAGLKAIGVPDGQGALDLVEDARPNLIVLDAVMAGLSGFDTCRRLKADPDHAHLPVIFITGLTETEHVVEGLRAGGVDYVTKPIVLEELIARIRVHLSTARLAHSARIALDMAGRSLFATDAEGVLLWRTPQAAQLLANLRVLTRDRTEWPPTLVDHVRRLIAKGHDVGAGSSLIAVGGGQLEIALLGRGGPDEYYFRMSEPIGGRESGILKTALGLTVRESEVLVWISSGKSNRDISDILNISPRTVNKHLEQIFTKLGVENRAAAAAVATRIVAAQS